MTGRIGQVSVSPGGVPKTAVTSARVTSAGVAGDAHRDREHHGGPDRAVCLFSSEIIGALQAEGHRLTEGTIATGDPARLLETRAAAEQRPPRTP